MKETLVLSGKIQVSQQEITEALTQWFLDKKQLKVTRAVYVTGDNQIKSAIFDVHQELKTDRSIPEFSIEQQPTKEEGKQRNMSSGWKRVNVGVYKNIKEFIAEYKKEGLSSVTFVKFLEDILFFHPKMTPEKFNIYLQDKRVFKNLFKYTPKEKMITF